MVDLGEPPYVIVVDDEAIARQAIATYLEREGFRVGMADGGAALRRLLASEPADLVLLDVRMPGEDGFSLARHLRETSPRLGIIMVTAKSDTVDRVVGLETGADDYIGKPFDPRELLARIKSVLRRAAPPAAGSAERGAAPQWVRLGRWQLDLERGVLLGADGAREALTATEFDLLKVFVAHPDRPLRRDWLLEVTSHRDLDLFDRSIDLRVARLRRKIEADPHKPTVLRTVRGIGYLFASAAD